MQVIRFYSVQCDLEVDHETGERYYQAEVPHPNAKLFRFDSRTGIMAAEAVFIEETEVPDKADSEIANGDIQDKES